MLLKNKVAIVTGGSKGIGASIVKELVKEGCKVAFTYKRNIKAARELEAKLKDKATAYKLDIKDPDRVKKFIEKIKKAFGSLDILVNNAGIMRNKPLMMMEREDWHDVINTNLNGTYNLTRACIVTFMKQKSGSIINISSAVGITGMPGQTNYAASKAGIIGFTKALAKEVGAYNIRVNAIAPGFIETDMLKDSKRRDEFLKWVPLGKFGECKDIAKLTIFLASDSARYITGGVIRLDGGLAI